MHKLSLVLITRDAAHLLPDALKSGAFADETLVLDSGSADQTLGVAKAHGARVERHEWLGFGAQKHKAVSLAAHDWVFVLDADERITSALRDEILDALRHPAADAYLVPRLNEFFGKVVKTCGMYPDYSIRLFNRKRAQFDDAPVHERVRAAGGERFRVAKMQNPMIHLAYDSVEQFITKQNRYAGLSRKKPSMFKALFSPLWTFLKLYILKRGFADGWRGYVISKLYAQYTFWKYIR